MSLRLVLLGLILAVLALVLHLWVFSPLSKAIEQARVEQAALVPRLEKVHQELAQERAKTFDPMFGEHKALLVSNMEDIAPVAQQRISNNLDQTVKHSLSFGETLVSFSDGSTWIGLRSSNDPAYGHVELQLKLTAKPEDLPILINALIQKTPYANLTKLDIQRLLTSEEAEPELQADIVISLIWETPA